MEVTPGAPAGQSRSLVEIGFAAVLAAAAVAVVATASTYPAESATYPAIIGAGMMVLAGWIGLREILRRWRGRSLPGGFAEHAPRLAIGVAALIVYFAAVSLIGFILPSLALCVLLPAAVGFRRWRLLTIVAVICVLAILAIFVYALGRSIPPDILSPFLGRLR